MAVSDRFESNSTPSQRAGAWTAGARDRESGKAVLIYTFDGRPLLLPGQLVSPNLPVILASETADGKGFLAADPGENWRRLRASEGPLTGSQLLDGARALRDAARLGLAHGDLGPNRLLQAEGRLLLEGYGVPWQATVGPFTAPEVGDTGATPAADLWSYATTVAQLGTEVDDETVEAVLELCRSQDPAERPTAEEFFLALEALLPAPQTDGPERSGATGLDYPRRGSPEAASTAVTPTPVENSAERRTDPERRAGRLRLTLLAGLMAAVVAFALLALYGPGGDVSPATAAQQNTVYVVEVFVSPEDLPPVTIHLLSAPPGSSLARGDRLGTAPRHLALDRAGTWAFQGSLQDRRSPVVEIQVPQERSFTLTIPP